MPGSEAPERKREIEKALDRLDRAVDRAVTDVGETRARARRAQSEYRRLREAVGTSDGAEAGDLDERLKEVAAENRRLRETLGLAREKAERIKRRLEVVEDEV